MEKIIEALRQDYSQLNFRPAAAASWSPEKNEITYNPADQDIGLWSLLHELGHAVLGHRSYDSDMALLQKEAQAWEKAISIARHYGIIIESDHIQDCLDTYRDWLHKRSLCPTCGAHGLQQSQALYRCLNCRSTWKVSSARFCRPYRLKKALEI
jgi:hypothetical protein